ncbi:rab proteins geranylgeranyltransferase component A [Anopheles nili]|uniref:rab proteins geranylgeranyltransferase component A n=1 Tax=Anopheles nili TaxID=185578 RepID=UPI00237A203F|nr:rab proteins geranylgeranyltransferase component A [Anopheles nili]
MEEDLPNSFDVIVIGTGLTESIVAAAASRIGKTVLHLDTNDYYGGYWASFNLESFRKYMLLKEHNSEREDKTVLTGINNFLPLCSHSTIVRNGKEKWFNFDENGDVDGWNQTRIEQEFRRFNIDLTPKLLYARGSMVELLISSNICRYTEFRALDRVATIWDGRIMTVPCSRSDVFISKDVNVIEKRLLMKFLQSCTSYDETVDTTILQDDIDRKTFLEHLQSHKLTPNLIHYVLYAIAMGNDRTPCREGLAAVKKFLMSLGHYGNSPFLFPVYGCGEIPQCFCRLCAVFGGIYCLSKAVKGINFETTENGIKYESVNCEEQTIRSKYLIVGQGYLSREMFINSTTTARETQKICGMLARAVILTNVPLGGTSQNTGGGGVAILKLPPTNNHKDGATILQMSHTSGTCPKDIYLIHVTTIAVTENPEADLRPYISQILSDDFPSPNEESVQKENTTSTILYEAYFNIPNCGFCTETKVSLPSGMHLSCGPYHELDYDDSILQAKSIFNELYPEELFLPRAPDPEEIIIEEEEPAIEQSYTLKDNTSDSVDSTNVCRETEIDTVLAQEAKEDSIDKAEECVEKIK